jgi:hypothetical protein
MANIATIVYKLGFGYDPFIHLATEKVLLATGTMLPRLFYYVGHYALILFSQFTTQLPLEFLNKIFVPVAFALIFPPIVFYSLKNILSDNPSCTSLTSRTSRSPALLTLVALYIPFTPFIISTPQGLTNLLALIFIFSYLNPKIPRWFPAFLGGITLLIHPLYGLPLLVASLFPFFKKLWARIILSAAFVLALPLSFMTLNWLKGLFSFQFHFSLSFFNWNNLWQLKRGFDFIPDLIYLYGFNYKIIFLIIALIGIIILINTKSFKTNADCLLFSGLTFASYLLTKITINFNFLVSYDQGDYLDRLIDLAFYFLLIYFLFAFYSLLKKVDWGKLTDKLFVSLILIFIVASSLYFSYPLFDGYTNTKAFNVSQADVDSVNFINEKAKENYIVLANQLVGAAAIREFGFAKYYGANFYYSIPTGGANNLYQYYLSMTDDAPERTYAEQAAKTAGVKQVFFVLDKYWKNSAALIQSAISAADESYEIDGGKNYVFLYKF